jgi:hypothetical protein
MSINSKTALLTKRIIDIRDEYRNVIQLLKKQHNFDEDEERDGDDNCTNNNY